MNNRLQSRACCVDGSVRNSLKIEDGLRRRPNPFTQHIFRVVMSVYRILHFNKDMNLQTSNLKRVLVQASSLSWSGEKDESLEPWGGSVKIVETILKLMKFFDAEDIQIIAPKFDQMGTLKETIENLGVAGLAKPSYSHDESPLLRMVESTLDLSDGDYILRINGQNCAFHEENLKKAISLIGTEKIADVIKFPDDYISQLTFDIYRVGALRIVAEKNPEPNQIHIHPKHEVGLNRVELPRELHYSQDEMWKIRSQLSKASTDFRLVNDKAISSANQLAFHYELATEYLKPKSRILDLACGAGFGTRILSKTVESFGEGPGAKSKLLAGDLIPSTLQYAINQNEYLEVDWKILDATDISLPDSSIDFFTCFETLEHVSNLESALSEFARILAPGGIGFFSTPQNCFGEIPLTWSSHSKKSMNQYRCTSKLNDL
jgi:ubiquinone/menaquinone biosynthesis C-methylase UbiE